MDLKNTNNHRNNWNSLWNNTSIFLIRMNHVLVFCDSEETLGSETFLSVIWGESVQRTCHHESWQHTFTQLWDRVKRTDSNAVIDTKPAAIVSAQVKNIMRRQCHHGDKGRPIRCVAAGRLLKNTRVCCAAIVTSAGPRKRFSAFLFSALYIQ